MTKPLFLDDVSQNHALDEVEVFEIWQGINLNSLPRLSPFQLFIDSTLEESIKEKAKSLGIDSNELAVSILKNHFINA